MISGETVTVYTRQLAGVDGFNNNTYSFAEETLNNVIVAPGEPQNETDDSRPDGKRVEYTIYLPKEYTGDLTGGKATVRGRTLNVIGIPKVYTDDNVPMQWNMVVKLEDIEG